MIDSRCLAADVDRSKIASDAEISGASYVKGSKTSIAAGAVIRDSWIQDADIGPGAIVVDSVLLAEGHPHQHKCDAAGRTVVRGADQPSVGAGARVSGCTLINTAVGAASTVSDSWLGDCRIGERCTIRDAKIIITNTDGDVTVLGPTEISEAHLGHHATIDRRGYLEGIFSNKFPRLIFDESAGVLKVADTVDLPHVSRYGVNTINSTNSGKLLPQPDFILRGLGEPAGLWKDNLLSHEQIELSPCCWVAPWTKIVGQSPLPHHSDDELVNDDLTTYLMPFALAGYGGDMARGLAMPGELTLGLGPKQRKGAWVFTYAPDAVFNMVGRIYQALEPARKHLADTLVTDAIATAIEMTKAMAYRNGRVDLSLDAGRQRPGWPKWIGATHALLRAHLDSGIWTFKDGRPVGWTRQGLTWTHPNFGAILALAPDAIENQKSEDDLFAFEDPVPARTVAVPTGAVHGTGGPAVIDPRAKVEPGAFVGPGCRIGPGTTIGQGAVVWNSVLDDCDIGEGSQVHRSIVRGGAVGPRSVVRSCRMSQTSLGRASSAQCAEMENSTLSDDTTITAFAGVRGTTTRFGTILGGAFDFSDVDVYLMTMHMAGGCEHLKAVAMPITIDGVKTTLPAIPMLGGGSLIRGTAQRPVEMQCCFLGSNAIVEAGTYVGLGCFILGKLGPDAGLLPFTISTDADVARHQIGAVLTSLPSIVLTHFVAWTYNAVGAAGGPAVAQMVRQGIAEGIAAVEWELARRSGEEVPPGRFDRYRCLGQYSPQQLTAGLACYRRSLDSGAWDMAFRDGQLTFISPNGQWIERSGSAFWKSGS